MRLAKKTNCNSSRGLSAYAPKIKKKDIKDESEHLDFDQFSSLQDPVPIL